MAGPRKSNTLKTNTLNNPADKKSKVSSEQPKLSLKPQHRMFLAVILMLISVYLIIGFISFAFSGRYDQSVIDEGLHSGVRSRNVAGTFGAFIANFFIHRGFGVSAIMLPFFFLAFSFALYKNKFWNELIIGFTHLFFWLYWISLSLGLLTFVFEFKNPDLAGGLGLSVVEWFRMFIGSFGCLVLLVIAMYLYISFQTSLGLPNFGNLNFVANSQNNNSNSTENIVQTQENTTEEPLPDPDKKKKEDDFIVSFTKRGKEVKPVEEDFIEAPSVVLINNLKDKKVDEIKEEKPEKTGSEEIKPENIEVLVNKDNSIQLDASYKEEKNKKPKGDIEFVIESTVNEMPVITLEKTPDSVFVNVAQVEDNKFEKIVSEEDIENLDEFEDVGDWEFYDPTRELSGYKYPTIDLLKYYDSSNFEVNRSELESNKNKIIKTLKDYNIEILTIKATVGPTVTLYEIVPAPGIRISKIKGLEDDIALSLSALGIRIIAPMPGKGTIGIEIPNSKAEIVSFRSVIATEKFRDSDAELPIALGKTISNEVFIGDLAKMPHLLVAGATGQGKSVGLNGIIASILFKKHPSQVKFVLVDPKKVEMSLFQVLEQHFLAKLPGLEDAIITDTKQVVGVLSSLCMEMDNRYDLLKAAKVRNISEYNAKFINRRLNPKKGHKFLPYIVLIIDELADLMMTAGKEVEQPIARLAQLARAIGIHLVVATQRPSVNVITGMIKANFPARLSFRVISKIDSRTILDTGGADQLVGRGDLLLSTGTELIRIQNPFISTEEIEAIVNFVADQKGYPEAYMLPEAATELDGDEEDDDAGERDSMFEDAARLIVRHQQGSTSLIQRRMKLGYNRAGRIMDQLEKAGIVGPTNGSKPREVYVLTEEELERFLNKLF